MIRHTVMGLLLRLARAVVAPRDDTAGEEGIHRLFVRELEGTFGSRQSVLDYARRLGYSESTLTRACLAATGQTAKQLTDQRIALEAKRMLVHSDASVVEIGHRLGFTEPTNFVKFFKRTAGKTPMEFRRVR